jgi:predicted ATPase/DNA-binding SARP family transcriptional activator
MSADSQVEFRLLGPFEVASGGRVVEISSAKQRLVLAMLTVHHQRTVALDALAEELWGEHPPASVAAAVQTLVYRIRRSLSAAGIPESAGLRSNGAGYLLDVDAARLDSYRFEELAASAREAFARGDPKMGIGLFRRALGLWRGPALGDLADHSFARIEGSRLDEARLEVVEELAEAELAAGEPAAALARLEPHLAEHLLRERAWGQLMVALYRLGRQAEALRAYQQLRRHLREELGLEPTPALRQLEQQILKQSPELDRAMPVVAEAPATDAAFPARADTLAFLFTDIEASTRRWEGDQDAMATDLARHDELMRQVVEDHHGHLFAHTGDGLGAAFPTASEALAAAVDGQWALLDQAWRAESPLRVRMALHAGAAESRHGTYFGPTLNRVARLLDMAAGGQILCSGAASDLARDHLPDGVTLVDLGEHRLADLSRPERLYQAVHPELPSDFGLARSPDAPLDNLPVLLTSFIGRLRELEELDKLLATSRLLTLTGVGGAGKTRLGLRLAAEVRDRFPDGVWVVELGPISDPSLVAGEIMAALGILVSGLGLENTAPEERLCDYLRLRSALLVLDTCEHLIKPVSDLVRVMLARCPGVTVLATSREVLGVPGEVPWPLPGLTLPSVGAEHSDELADSDAVALFCARAADARPGFGLTDANAGAVAQICRRLDGIPLALELAATRIRVLGAHQVAERLNNRFRLLSDGGRTTVSRHQTLRATMDWSYELIPEPEQALLRRLAAFPQTFDLEAVEGIWDDTVAPGSADVLDLLARLVDKSLVVVESSGTDVRYRLLDTVREYGLEKLTEAGELDAARRRHRDYFLEMALSRHNPQDEGIGTWWEPAWMMRADDERENFHAALDWSVTVGDHWAAVALGTSLWPYWLFWKGFLGTPYNLLARALAAPEPVLDAFRVEALLGLRIALIETGEGGPQRANELLDEAHRVAMSLGDPLMEARSRFYIGQAAHGSGDIEEGQRQLETSLALYEKSRYRWGVAWCHHELGWAAMAGRRLDEAEIHFEQALAHHTADKDNKAARPHALAALATVVAVTGDPNRAQALAEEAVTVARGTCLRQVLVAALVRAGEVAVLTGRTERARTVLLEALGILSDLGARRWVADTLEATALLLEAHGRVEATARLLGTSEALRLALHEPQIALPALTARLAGCRAGVEAALGAGALAAAALEAGDDLQQVLRLARIELEAFEE